MIFKGIQKYSAPNKVNFTMAGIQFKNYQACKQAKKV